MALVSATQLITRATVDLGNLRPGQGEAPDALNACLTHLNDLMDALTQERFNVYKSDATVLVSFADLTTNYNLAPGFAEFLRKALAVRIYPSLRLLLKVKEPPLEEIGNEASLLKKMLQGVGVGSPAGGTLNAIANDALADLGVILLGQTAPPDILQGCLRSINERVDLWQIEKLLVAAYPGSIFNLTALQKQYTIGPNEAPPNFTAPRPTFIQEANLILNNVSPVLRLPMRLYNVDRWSDIAIQDYPSGALPQNLYYVRDFNNTVGRGCGTILIWPAAQQNWQLELFLPQPLQSFADLTTTYIFSPGYQRLIAKQLAVDIAPRVRYYSKLDQGDFDKQIQMAMNDLREARNAVESYNAPNPLSICDPMFSSAHTGAKTGGLAGFLSGWER